MLSTKVMSESFNVRLLEVKASSNINGDERESDELWCLIMQSCDLVDVFVYKYTDFFFSSSGMGQVDLLLLSLLASRRHGEESSC